MAIKTKLPKWAAGAAATSSGPGPSGTEQVQQQSTEASAQLPSGIVPLQFGTDNLEASASAQQLFRAWPGSAATFAQTGVPALYRGSIVGMALRANTPKTAGAATFEAYVDGVASAARLAWGNNAVQIATFPSGTYLFMAAAELDVRVTTDSAFLPTTVDLELILFIAQTTTEAQA